MLYSFSVDIFDSLVNVTLHAIHVEYACTGRFIPLTVNFSKL